MKMQKHYSFILCLVALFISTGASVMARENVGQKRNANKGLRTTAACAPSSSAVELDANNVRCLLHNGGDYWWDLASNPRYEVPKYPKDQAASARHSSFAGSLWIGGVDESGQLRVAAQTYRQSGNDFWPGPLTSDGASIDDVTCQKWDEHYKITKVEIDAFRSAFDLAVRNGTAFNPTAYPAVNNWPAFGEDANGNRLSLAPFVDVDGDITTYNPAGGDYPDIAPCVGGGSPDQAVWWVINDKGDVHTETGGEAIGVEIHVLAFAFATANAINDMTFYKYKVINKSTLKLNDTYMGQWVDSDIGNAFDDYVGCDTTRGLGFAYNGDPTDDGASGYGVNPPTLGLDFFQGPFGDDNQRIPMTYFVYYENDFSLRGNPEVSTHFYGYLRGFWKDGSRMVDNNKNGYPGTGAGPETNYMYPGDPGFCGGSGSGWSEESANNSPYDRRFVQSAGPFTLQPGAVNDIIVGAVWARANYNDNLGSVCELLTADDIAQALFDACFQLLDGPDAPELTIEEFDQELMLAWDYPNRLLTNNYDESYLQPDPVLVSQGIADSLFQFEGYILYQLKDGSVSGSDIFDTDKARIVAQCDLRNDVSTIVNRTTSNVAGLTDPIIIDQVMVQGANEGIIRSFRATEDLFASGADRRLKNYTTYYYGIVAYAFNNVTSDGRQFVQGNRGFASYSAVPHKIRFESFGTVVGADYGDGIQITQTAGVGNGGNFVKLAPETVNSILDQDSVGAITYQSGAAPITVKVINPKEIKAADYRVDVVGSVGTKRWAGTADTIAWDPGVLVIWDSTFVEWELFEDGVSIFTSTYIQRSTTTPLGTTYVNRPDPLSGTERPIPGRGFSIGVANVGSAGDTLSDGVIGATLTFEDPMNNWLTGLGDEDGFEPWDWIKAGDEAGDKGHEVPAQKTAQVFDKDEYFESMVGGTWAPFCLAKEFTNNDASGEVRPGVRLNTTNAPVVGALTPNEIVSLRELPDVDIVFTSDTTKWSRCIVIETASSIDLGTGAFPMSARYDYPIRNQGDVVKDQSVSLSTWQGYSWFPGYAIDVNTGRRLNIFFGENSWDRLNNGADMLFNPTSSNGATGDLVGGRHFVYVSNTKYDGCKTFALHLINGTQRGSGSNLVLWEPGTTTPDLDSADMRKVYNTIAWVGLPKLSSSFSFSTPQEIPTTATVQLRVKQPIRSRGATTDHPQFTFSTDAIAVKTQVSDEAKASVMEDIRVVPNPYYAYSRYEQSQLQTLVKITNLPQKCKIKIFTLNGTMVRSYTKDSDEPSQNWDLKNQDGVPVASGVYIIHVDGFELGEAVVKFFAVMPEIDLNSF
jgi:hypothetical protein